MGRFWTMLSHYHGGVWNATETANALGLAVNTVRSYLDALDETYKVRRLPPWFENTGKRIGVEIKRTDAPKPRKGYGVLIDSLRLDHLYVIYPGERRYPIREKCTALPFREILSEMGEEGF